MSVTELNERHVAATGAVNALRERLRQRRQLLLDTDSTIFFFCSCFFFLWFWFVSVWLIREFLDPMCLCFSTLQSLVIRGRTGRLRSASAPLIWFAAGFFRDILGRNRIVSASQDGRLIVWNALTSQKTHAIKLPCAWVMTISINSSNTKMFVSGSCDSTARLWDTRIASRAVRTYHGHEGDVNTVKFFPDGQRFGTGSDDGTCRLFDMRTGHQLQVYSQQPGENCSDVPTVTSMAFSISGRLLFAGYSNGGCYVWDTLVAKVVLNLGAVQNSHEGRISCLGLSADGSALCTGSWDKNLKIWAFGGYRRVI
ncbi:hypothetical protein Taro_015835 [Colocasia esculenta]|uniref:Uncharacterized protein n=1 Tax=Colocasia esculenta TaxID=4460 RepID=A0A843UM85_COLES|nr:hypothetical protein [Colocasia esculenta]